MRVRRCGSVRSDYRRSAERAIRSVVATTPTMIPAIAADRQLRQKAG
jgi:hypothetical protein